MAEDTIIFDDRGPVASITFNRPDKANYIDNDWIAGMHAFFLKVAKDPAVRAVVVKANGKHFMAGGDLNYHDEVIAMDHKARFGDGMLLFERWSAMQEALLAVPQPVIAVVQGGAIGASFGLVLSCDIVVAADDAFFVLAHVLHGGAPDGLLTYWLPRQIGVKKTLELMLMGERISASEAKDLGLVTKVVPRAGLEAGAQAMIDQFANGPTVAYGLIKELVWGSLERNRAEQAMLENVAVAKSSLTLDWEEGSDAVFRKRDARFVGR